MKRKTIDTSWEKRTYDVWGNKQDGFDINDSFSWGSVQLELKIRSFNTGTPQEFFGAYPSEYQLKRIFGTTAGIDVDGDDMNIYVTRQSDGYPIGELRCLSHESLSPIRIQTKE